MLKLGFQDVTVEHAVDLWEQIARCGGGDGGTVTRAAFLRFLQENERYQLLFDLLGDEAREVRVSADGRVAASPRSRLPMSRHKSFVRRRELLRRGAPQE